MSDTNHILYSVISFVITAILIVLFVKTVKNQNVKNGIVKACALTTVLIHYSPLYYDYFTTGSAEVYGTMLLPIYPCNVAMWLLVLTAFWKNKGGGFFRVLAESTFYLGVVGGVVGILFNEIYISDPDLTNWHVLHGLLSHSTMLLGCIYLLAGGYIKIRVDNVVSGVCCLLLLIADGIVVIAIHRLCGLTPPNCMFLLENPFPQIKWFNPLVLGVFAVLLLFAVTAVYEQIALEKEDRWYSRLQKKLEEVKLK